VRRILMFAITASLIGAAPPPPVTTPVVVELFTSQGCSSCPPADAFMEELAQQPNIIAITRPVTYWDRLGWKDTLAREENTQLQKAYSDKGLEGSGVYTPQIVVQGEAGAVGSRRDAVKRLVALEKARPGPGIAAVRTDDGGRRIAISPSPQGGFISIVALKAETVVRIGSGENGGRTVRYSHVALNEVRAGQWDGRATAITLPGSAFATRGADLHALLIRAKPAGRIVAARYL
jgi:hypothetical protein